MEFHLKIAVGSLKVTCEFVCMMTIASGVTTLSQYALLVLWSKEDCGGAFIGLP